MRTLAWPETVEVAPGESGFVSVAITNTSGVIDAYRVQVFGLDPSWIEVEPSRLSLFPGDTETVAVTIRLPDDYPASRRTLAVNVVSDDDPGKFELTQVELAVQPQTHTTVKIDPVMVTSGKKATFGMVVGNVGNAAVSATGFAIDPEALAEFSFEPDRVVVAPGREQIIQVTAQGGRAWFGQQRARTFTMGVESEQRVESLGTFVQRPRIGRWLLSLLGLLTAAAVFAAVLSRTFDQVVEDARVSSVLLDAALSSGEAGGAVVPTNPGTVSGRLFQAGASSQQGFTRQGDSPPDGQGLSGAQAELFVVGDEEVPVSSAATDDTGSFTFANLGEGTYLLKLSGAGVESIWYGNTPTAVDAKKIEVKLGELTELDPITIGGIPVEVAGVIGVDDPNGVTVSLVVPGQVDPDGSAVVATATLGPDGSFVLEDVPSPGAYQMVIEKPGFATETRGVVLEPGKPLDGVEVTLRPGNGIIDGTVAGPAGPLGGATIVASDGTNEVETVSLTEGTVGTFVLRNLATPGQYTVTISRDGFAPEARTVSLDENQGSASFSARLLPATGSVQGRALVNGLPARGLDVAISGGEENHTTSVISQGASAATYSFSGLPAPGTYTLTFSGLHVIPQVRVVDLDPTTGTENAVGVDVSLSPERTTVRGLVRDVDGSPSAQATVVLSDGAESVTLLTADDPIGEFEFSDIAPGAYTLTASRLGTEAVVVLVNVSATTPTPPLDLQLGAQASLTGLVTGFDPTLNQVTVKLFEPSLFPVLPITDVQTDTTGNYEFTALNAPTSYVVAVYASPDAADPLDSVVVITEPGIANVVPTLNVTIP